MSWKQVLAWITVSSCLILLNAGCGKKILQGVLIEEVKGTVQTRITRESLFEAAKPKMALAVGGAIKSGDDGFARISFPSGATIEIRPDTFFEIGEDNNLGKQANGEALFQVKPQGVKTTVETPHGVTAILGTKFLQQISSDSTTISLFEGKVQFMANNGKSETLDEKKQLTIKNGTVQKPLEMDPFLIQKLQNPGVKLPGLNQR